MSESQRKFVPSVKGKYSLEEKDALGKLCKQYKEEYEAAVKSDAGKLNYNDKMKMYTKKVPREGYIVKVVHEFYPDLKNARHEHLRNISDFLKKF